MKKALSFVTASLVGLTVLLSPCDHTNALEGPLSTVNSYRIYYHVPTSTIMEEMQKLDLVIIEPYHYTKEQIEFIQSKGTLVFGYISTMEVANWNKTLVEKLRPTDYFYRNNEKVYFPAWDSYLMDITSEHYREILTGEVEAQVAKKGFDGIFLDTVGDIDDQHYHDQALLKEQRTGLKQFLASIKELYPNKLLIQNWGIDTLMTTTAPYVDGIMWENFNYKHVAKDEWSLTKVNELKKLQEAFWFEVFTVSSEMRKKSRKYSQKQGFINYYTENGYDSWK
ncbi:putative glycoside hydrolase [Bacillus salitolerans]|uniref:Glycoside hydrolase n=1 Tax=Bacillus salitolerans TaxID=1437434 RepID=A0ABW4LL58_9BACI